MVLYVFALCSIHAETESARFAVLREPRVLRQDRLLLLQLLASQACALARLCAPHALSLTMLLVLVDASESVQCAVLLLQVLLRFLTSSLN